MSSDDRTVVGGGPLGDGDFAPGTTLGERYEIRAYHRSDALSEDYFAFDTATETEVSLRIIRSELFDDAEEVQQVRVRLESAVGIGGRFLPGLSDVSFDYAHLYVVEPLSQGASFRQVLDARLRDGRVLKPRELLPVVARIAAGLDAIPPPLHHGDVRAERIWFDADSLYLTGAFILPALPPGPFARVLNSSPDLRTHFAPEATRGGASGAADRYSVALIAHEALTGELPSADTSQLARKLGDVGDALHGLLHSESSARDQHLKRLVEALAEASELPVPDLDPSPFRRTRRRKISEPVPKGRRIDTPDPDLFRQPTLPADGFDTSAFLEDTKRVHADEVVTPETEQKSSSSVVDTDAFDPRLVRAALDVELSSETDLDEEEDLDSNAPPARDPDDTQDLRPQAAAAMSRSAGSASTGSARTGSRSAASSTAPRARTFARPDVREPREVTQTIDAADLIPFDESEEFTDPSSVPSPSVSDPSDLSEGGYYAQQQVVLFDAEQPVSSLPPELYEEPTPPPGAFDTGALARLSQADHEQSDPPPPISPSRRAPTQRLGMRAVPPRPAPPQRSMIGSWVLLAAVAISAAIILGALYVKKQRDRDHNRLIQERLESVE